MRNSALPASARQALPRWRDCTLVTIPAPSVLAPAEPFGHLCRRDEQLRNDLVQPRLIEPECRPGQAHRCPHITAGVADRRRDGSQTPLEFVHRDGVPGVPSSRDGGEQPLAGSTLEQATAAALQHTGGGTVTETETGDGGAAYGVEVRLADGSQVEVELDEGFNVIGQEADDDGPNESDGPNDD